MADTGFSSFIEVSYEDTWGVAETTGFVDTLLLDATGSIKESENVEEHGGPGSRLINQLTSGKYTVGGSISGKVQGGRLFAYALGTDTKTGTGVPYTHTLAVNDTTSLSSFTMDMAHIKADKAKRVAGCKIMDFSLNLDAQGVLTADFNWEGRQASKVASSVGTRSQSTSSVFTGWMGSLTWNAQPIECTTFNFSYNNNLGTDEISIGERRRKAITEGQVTMSGSFGLVFSDFTVYDDFQTAFSTATSNETGTDRTLAITLDNGGATTAEREIALSLTTTRLTELDHPVTFENGRVVATYNYIPKTLNSFTIKDDVSTNYITGV